MRYDEWFATTFAGRRRVCGLVAIELATRAHRDHPADAVILCTGGCGRYFHSPPTRTSRPARHGARIPRARPKDMEFIPYHPTGLSFAGILITEAARAEGGWLATKTATATSRIDPQQPTLEPRLQYGAQARVRQSQAFVREHNKGRTVDTVRPRRLSRPAAPGADLIDAKLLHYGVSVPRLPAHRPRGRVVPTRPGGTT